jgi:hypothetical protein
LTETYTNIILPVGAPNIIRVTRSRRMRWVGHIAHMGEMSNAYNILVGKPEVKRPLKHLGIDKKIKIEWILGK